MPNLPPRPGWKHWLPRHPRDINKREQMLLMLGFIWVMIGFSALESGSSRPMTLLHEHIPIDVRGWAWILSGVIAMFVAWRPPGVRDTIGWAFLYIMPTLRVVSYLLAWFASWDFLPLDEWPLTEPYEDGWRFAAVYLAQSLTIVICSGWPNPIQTSELTREERKEAIDDF